MKWGLQFIRVAFAGTLIAMLPAVVIYFMIQKYIMGCMTAGAFKNKM